MTELMELKNTIRELHEACTSFNSRIDQTEERISEVKDQLNEIRWETKIREKRAKTNEQSLQEMWDYVKRPNLCLIGVPESDEENESKLENTVCCIQETHLTCKDTKRFKIKEWRKIYQENGEQKSRSCNSHLW